MKIELISESGRFYKVNLHCHTTVSDGKQTPEEIKETYKALGYSAVCYTDHEVLIDHSDLTDSDFIALNGYEIAIKSDLNLSTGKGEGLFMPVYHFCFISKQSDNLIMPKLFKNNPSFPGAAKEWVQKCAYDEIIDSVYYYDKAWLSDYLLTVSENGFFVNYNHPEWSLQTVADVAELKGIHSIEVANNGAFENNDNTTIHYSQLLRAGMKVFPTGSDDNHSLKSVGGAWTMLKAEELSYGALIDAYSRGDMYASWGPEIYSLILEDEEIKIKTSSAKFLTLLSEGRYVERFADNGGGLTEAAFKYTPDKMGRYFRIEVKDAEGNVACTVPYYIRDIEQKMKENSEK